MDELNRDYERWVDADVQGNDEDADAACRDLFNDALPLRLVPARFASDTMARIVAAKAADARRARRARAVLLWGSATAGPVAVYFGAGAAMSAAAGLLLAALNLLVNATVKIANMSELNLWSLTGSLGRALAAIMSDADVTIVVIAMHGIAFAALVALQRLLGPDTESFK